MAIDEEGEDARLEDPEWNENDITSYGHEDLEMHREFREFARIAAWEMPLLTSMLHFPCEAEFSVVMELTSDIEQSYRNHLNLQR
jgi:hypothetical protein